MRKREIISGIVTALMFIDILGLTGSAEIGEFGFSEYASAAVVRLIIMGAALLFGSDIMKRGGEKGEDNSDNTGIG